MTCRDCRTMDGLRESGHDRSIARSIPFAWSLIWVVLTGISPASALTFEERIKLTASDPKKLDRFGQFVALQGDTTFVAAPVFRLYRRIGAVHVFERDTDGSWNPHQLLTPSDDYGDDLGMPIVVDGDTAFIATSYDDDNGNDSGSVHVFTRSAGYWDERAKLLASDGSARNYFGSSVAVEGDVALIGAPGDDDNGFGSGSAYVYERDAGGNWIEAQKLTASDGLQGESFGRAVALAGDTAFVGAPGDEENGFLTGSIYVFRRAADGRWSEQSELHGDSAGFNFGHFLAFDGRTLLVGASGAVDVVERNAGGDWVVRSRLSVADASGSFGSSIAVRDGVALIGDTGNDQHGYHAGKVFAFVRDDAGEWIEHTGLTASDADGYDFFGASVALDGNYAVIGAHREGGSLQTGAVYVLELVRDPLELLARMSDRVRSLGLPPGVEQGLLAPLDTAMRILGDLQPANDQAATNVVSALVRRLEAVQDEQLPEQAVAALIEDAASVLEQLEGVGSPNGSRLQHRAR